MAELLLTTDLLDNYADRLGSLGVAAVDFARPGLSQLEMTRLAASVDLRLPAEALTWWGWHDGAEGPLREIGPWREWLSLEQAVSECRRIRQMLGFMAGGPADTFWSPGWLPLVNAEGLVVIDTDVPLDAPCPVHIYWFDEGRRLPDLGSIGDLIMIWTDAIDRGAWGYDGASWVSNGELLESWPAAKRGIV